MPTVRPPAEKAPRPPSAPTALRCDAEEGLPGPLPSALYSGLIEVAAAVRRKRSVAPERASQAASSLPCTQRPATPSAKKRTARSPAMRMSCWTHEAGTPPAARQRRADTAWSRGIVRRGGGKEPHMHTRTMQRGAAGAVLQTVPRTLWCSVSRGAPAALAAAPNRAGGLPNPGNDVYRSLLPLEPPPPFKGARKLVWRTLRPAHAPLVVGCCIKKRAQLSRAPQAAPSLCARVHDSATSPNAHSRRSPSCCALVLAVRDSVPGRERQGCCLACSRQTSIMYNRARQG